MIARAMSITGLRMEFMVGEAEDLLAEFVDANESKFLTVGRPN